MASHCWYVWRATLLMPTHPTYSTPNVDAANASRYILFCQVNRVLCGAQAGVQIDLMNTDLRRAPYEPMIDKQIALLAYQYWEERGRPLGSPEVDWFRATEEMNRQHQLHGIGF